MAAGAQQTIALERPVVKHAPSEFLVRENLLVPLSEPDAGRYTYLELRKSGLTTFEAVGAVARHFGAPPAAVQHAGLKDEDGVSEQLISLDGRASPAAVRRFNSANGRDPRRYMHLRRYGSGDEPLRTGSLTGNSFRIRVRNLSPDAAARLAAARRYEFHFLNYYDLQRFGVADGPKTTHMIGGALVAGDHATALALLRAAATPESESALAHDGAPEAFFAALDPRVTSFFKSSHASHVWNERLSAIVREAGGVETYEHAEAGIPFVFSRRQADVLAVLARRPALPYPRYYGDGPAGARFGLRATVIQVQVHCHGTAPDDAHPPDGQRCDLSFFLPSGTYATMCVRQLANTVDLGSA